MEQTRIGEKLLELKGVNPSVSLSVIHDAYLLAEHASNAEKMLNALGLNTTSVLPALTLFDQKDV